MNASYSFKVSARTNSVISDPPIHLFSHTNKYTILLSHISGRFTIRICYIFLFLGHTFKEAIADCEAKKSKFYGNFVGNLPFAPQIDYSYSFTIQRIIRNLSYKELCIIRYFKDNGILKLQNFDSFKNNGLNVEKNELSFYFKDLLSLGVIHKAPPLNMQYELDNMKLSPLGDNICKLLNLQEID